MVQPEDGVSWRAVRVGHGAVEAADGPMASGVEGRCIGDELEVAKVGDGHGRVDLGLAGEVTQGVVGEVAAETAGRGSVGLGLRAEKGGEVCKGPVGDAAASAAVGEIEWRATGEVWELGVG